MNSHNLPIWRDRFDDRFPGSLDEVFTFLLEPHTGLRYIGYSMLASQGGLVDQFVEVLSLEFWVANRMPRQDSPKGVLLRR